MTWFKIDDGAYTHPKMIKAGNAAVGLWLRCGAYAAQHLTEGHVPAVVAGMLGTGPQVARLVKAGLWHESGHACLRCPPVGDGYLMHDFLVYNPSRASVEDARRRESDRKQRGRDRRRSGARPSPDAPRTAADPDPDADGNAPDSDPDSGESAGEGGVSHRDGAGVSRSSRPGPSRAVSGGGSRESADRRGPAPDALCALPADWEPDDALLAWAMAAGHMQRLELDGLDHATAKWRTHRAAGPKRTPEQWRLDWQQWITRERPDAPPAGRHLRAVPPARLSRADQHAAALQAALDEMNNASRKEGTA